MNLLRDKYPVNTVEQVKTASDYFESNITAFDPLERVLITSRLEKKASEFGLNLDRDYIKVYSRPMHKEATESPVVAANAEERKDFAKSKGVDNVKITGKDFKYADMVDKVVKSDADMITKTKSIAQLDKVAGLDAFYDKGLQDPVSMFSSCPFNQEYDAVKIAGDMTNYDLARMPIEKVASCMGEDFASDFTKDRCHAVYSLGVGDKEKFLNLMR